MTGQSLKYRDTYGPFLAKKYWHYVVVVYLYITVLAQRRDVDVRTLAVVWKKKISISWRTSALARGTVHSTGFTTINSWAYSYGQCKFHMSYLYEYNKCRLGISVKLENLLSFVADSAVYRARCAQYTLPTRTTAVGCFGVAITCRSTGLIIPRFESLVDLCFTGSNIISRQFYMRKTNIASPQSNAWKKKKLFLLIWKMFTWVIVHM